MQRQAIRSCKQVRRVRNNPFTSDRRFAAHCTADGYDQFPTLHKDVACPFIIRSSSLV